MLKNVSVTVPIKAFGSLKECEVYESAWLVHCFADTSHWSLIN